jgi:hypothetical protein
MKRYFIYILLVLFSCGKKRAARSIYYWKTTYELTDFEEKFLRTHQITHMYVRLFDVDWAENKKAAMPVGMIQFAEPIQSDLTYIPVVYITNKTMLKLSNGDIPKLAMNMHTTIRGICKKAGINYDEVQFDCDWSDQSRDNFFMLINAYKKLQSDRPIAISSTLRLHQVKYKNKTGIPPVDRVTLMFYNMGDRTSLLPNSSILNADIGANYLKNYSYPLPVTLALPVFEWVIQHRNGKPIRLISNFNEKQAPLNKLKRMKPHLLTVEDDFYFMGIFYKKGDVIKQEGSDQDEISKSIKYIRKAGINPIQTILYHLDSANLNTYSHEFIEEIYTAF